MKRPTEFRFHALKLNEGSIRIEVLLNERTTGYLLMTTEEVKEFKLLLKGTSTMLYRPTLTSEGKETIWG
jgi:hypothetical protein